MSAAVQRDLARIAVAAYFDAEFRDDAPARCFLRYWHRENPDVRVRTRSAPS